MPSVLSLLILGTTGILIAGPGFSDTFIDPSDSNIRYTGRWDFTDPSQPWCQAKGSSIIVLFNGTSIAATSSGSTSEYLRVIIDDDVAGSVKLQLQPGRHMVLASGLADSQHKLELVKETDRDRMVFEGLTLDTGETLDPPPPRPTRRIEFYGDSNLAGYSLESERNQDGSELTGSYYTFAGIVARMFDAEYVNFSLSGAWTGSLLDAYDRIDWFSAEPTWNFDDFPADLVVLNIGANDLGSVSSIKARYHLLLDAMRAAHPSAHIVLYNAYGWDFDEPSNFTHEVIAESGDANTSVATFPWFFEQFHGCEYDHGGMAHLLAEHITDVLGWIPSDADVMNGFGVGGDVANGSFEEIAPFGGYGWRYLDDTGVSRIFDPVNAFDGDHYLELAAGASTHQNIDASNGQTFTVEAWMRAVQNGDTVAISMDFRDQDAGAGQATPLQSTTEIKTLTTEWQRFSLTATAPLDPMNPVFHTRVTFTASHGATVYVDGVVEFSGRDMHIFSDGFETGDFSAWDP